MAKYKVKNFKGNVGSGRNYFIKGQIILLECGAEVDEKTVKLFTSIAQEALFEKIEEKTPDKNKAPEKSAKK